VSRALLIIDHGSRRPDAHTHLEWIASQVRGLAKDLLVYIAHMEVAEPSIPQAIAECAAAGVTELIVHPLFLVPGRHLTEQIPNLVEEAASRHPGLRVRVTAQVGSAPGIAELILATLHEV
jgi:sirohydrochlorin ferrochelatase